MRAQPSISSSSTTVIATTGSKEQWANMAPVSFGDASYSISRTCSTSRTTCPSCCPLPKTLSEIPTRLIRKAMKRKLYIWLLLGVSCLLSVSCSSTSGVPEGDQLYTGISKINYTQYEKSPHFVTTSEEIEAALACEPNGAFLGSSYYRTPRSEERRVGKECRSRWSPYH